MGFYHLRKIIPECDFPNLFESCFLHWFLPGRDIGNGYILGGFGHQLSMYSGSFSRCFSEGDFRAKARLATQISRQQLDHRKGQIYVSANTSN